MKQIPLGGERSLLNALFTTAQLTLMVMDLTESR